MERIIIIGNSGSGKTYLASKLSAYFGYPIIQLDLLFWEQGGFNTKRPKEIVYSEITRLAKEEKWIVEGVFGELAKEFFGNADYLIWLDLDHGTCIKNLLQRDSESAMQLDREAAEESFQKLIEWASNYWGREGPRSYHGHLSLFRDFSGNKRRIGSRQAVDEFLTSITNSCLSL